MDLFKLIGVVALINCVYSQNPSENDIDCENFDLIGAVPFKEVSMIITNAIRYDPETQNAANFLQSSNFKILFNRLVLTIQNRPLLGFIAGVGLQVADVMDHLTDTIKNQLEDDQENKSLYNENYAVDTRKQIGVSGVLRKIVDVLPADKIKSCFNLKLNAKPAFKHIVEQMNTPEFQNAIESLRQTDNYQALATQLEERGIEFNTWLGEAIKFFNTRSN